jgi:hypothetical protein
MQTTKSLASLVSVLMTVASLMLLSFGAMTAFAAGTTLQEHEAVWGKPIAIQKLDNGMEERFYKYQGTGAIGYSYAVNKDGIVIDTGLAVSVPELAKVEKDGLAFSPLSIEFYQRHPMTARDVEAT